MYIQFKTPEYLLGKNVQEYHKLDQHLHHYLNSLEYHLHHLENFFLMNDLNVLEL